MKKLLNTLYITTPSSYLSKGGTNVVVSADGKEIFRIPIQNIESIITFGYQGASPGLMKLCVDNHVNLSFYAPNGRFIARICGSVNGNVLLRRKQYRLIDDQEFSLNIASLIIAAKIYNSRACLRRFVRDYPGKPGIETVSHNSDILKQKYRLARQASTLDVLRGIEGDAAAVYFKAFPHLIINKNPQFIFSTRNRRPPTDIVNAMLSFGYSLLANDCSSALEGVGLDPAAGFMHSFRPGRNSLALDIMEEFRSYIVDRFVLTMINNRQITPSDFIIHTNAESDIPLSVSFTDNGKKKYLTAWQTRKKTEITHPFLNEKVPIGMLPHIQALLLARYLRGDLDNYPVFLIK